MKKKPEIVTPRLNYAIIEMARLAREADNAHITLPTDTYLEVLNAYLQIKGLDEVQKT
jgi:hypothetical protein